MAPWQLATLLPILLAGLEKHAVGAARHDARDLGALAKRQQCGSNVQDQCNQGASACVSAICASCADVPDIAQCCALSGVDEEAQCVINALQGGGDASSTTAAAVTNDPNLAACATWESIVGHCASETPRFSSLTPFARQASCLCYSSSTYDPARYDRYFASCLSYFSTADPSGYDSIFSGTTSLDLAPCSAAGNVLSSPVSVSASPTSGSRASTTFAPTPTSTTTAPFGSPTGSATSGAHDAPLKRAKAVWMAAVVVWAGCLFL